MKGVDAPLGIGIAMDFLTFTVVLLMLGLLVGGLLAYWKLAAKIDNLKESRSGAFNMHFRQVEALMALYYRLQPRIPFPFTRGWAASPDFLLTVANCVLDRRPSTIVECGSGVSTIVMARCAQLNTVGHVYSLEHDARFALATRDELSKQGLSDFATVIHAPLVETSIPDWDGKWYELSGLAIDGLVDFVVVDGPPVVAAKLARYPAGPAFFGRLSEGAMILLDDADRADEKTIADLWSKRFHGLSALTLPECEKGSRGFVWLGSIESFAKVP